jgi:uncharacterized Tic20 family protein
MTDAPIPAPTKTQDERIIAALAHASAILPMWGAIAAIVLWATQKDKSPFAGFQSLQAVAYHLTMIVGAMLFGVCYMCSALTMPLSTLLFLPSDPPSTDISPFAFLPMAFPFAVMGIGLLAGVAFVAYGLFAAAMTLQGKDFRYIVIGKKLEAYLAAK